MLVAAPHYVVVVSLGAFSRSLPGSLLAYAGHTCSGAIGRGSGVQANLLCCLPILIVRAQLHIQSRQWRREATGDRLLRVRKTEALLLKVWQGGCIVGIRSVASAPNRIAACGKTQTSPILIGSPPVVKHRRPRYCRVGDFSPRHFELPL